VRLKSYEVTNWGPHRVQKIEFPDGAKTVALCGENDQGKSWIVRGIGFTLSIGRNEYGDQSSIHAGEAEATHKLVIEHAGADHVIEKVVKGKLSEDEGTTTKVNGEAVGREAYEKFFQETLGLPHPSIWLPICIAMQNQTDFHLRSKKRDREEALRAACQLYRIDSWKEALATKTREEDKRLLEENASLKAGVAAAKKNLIDLDNKKVQLLQTIETLQSQVGTEGEEPIAWEEILQRVGLFEEAIKDAKKASLDKGNTTRELNLAQNSLKRAQEDLGKIPGGNPKEELAWEEARENLLSEIQARAKKKAETGFLANSKEMATVAKDMLATAEKIREGLPKKGAEPTLNFEGNSEIGALKAPLDALVSKKTKEYGAAEGTIAKIEKLEEETGLGKGKSETEKISKEIGTLEESIGKMEEAIGHAKAQEKILGELEEEILEQAQNMGISLGLEGRLTAAVLENLLDKELGKASTCLELAVFHGDKIREILGKNPKVAAGLEHTCPVCEGRLPAPTSASGTGTGTKETPSPAPAIQGLISKAELWLSVKGHQSPSAQGKTKEKDLEALRSRLKALRRITELWAELGPDRGEKLEKLKTEIDGHQESLRQIGEWEALVARKEALEKENEKLSVALDEFADLDIEPPSKDPGITALDDAGLRTEAKSLETKMATARANRSSRLSKEKEIEATQTKIRGFETQIEALTKNLEALNKTLQEGAGMPRPKPIVKKAIEPEAEPTPNPELDLEPELDASVPAPAPAPAPDAAEAAVGVEDETWEEVASEWRRREEAMLRAQGALEPIPDETKELEERLQSLQDNLAVNEQEAQRAEAARKLVNFLDYKNAPRKLLENIVARLFEVTNRLGEVLQVDIRLHTEKGLEFMTRQIRAGKVIEQKTERLGFGKGAILGICFRLACQKLLLPETGFLILDEPTANVDLKRKSALKAFLQNLGEEQESKTKQIILIEHDQDVVELCQAKITVGEPPSALDLFEETLSGGTPDQ
jgi:hypothetical protein